MASPSGILKKNRKLNTYEIASHEQRSKVHIYLLHELKKTKILELEQETSDLIDQRDKPGYTVTNRHIRLLITAIKMGVTLAQYPNMVYLHKRDGVDMGHLCGTPKGLVSI